MSQEVSQRGLSEKCGQRGEPKMLAIWVGPERSGQRGEPKRLARERLAREVSPEKCAQRGEPKRLSTDSTPEV